MLHKLRNVVSVFIILGVLSGPLITHVMAGQATPAAEPTQSTGEPAVIENGPADGSASPTAGSEGDEQSAPSTPESLSQSGASVISLSGQSVTVSDGNGNEFAFTVQLVSDGTGHGTTAQCFINANTGYAVGDNLPADGVMCSGDTATWRIDYNVVTSSDPPPLILNLSTVITSTSRFSLSVTGATGGGDIPFTGTVSPNPGAAPVATIAFRPNSNLSGFFTVTNTPVNAASLATTGFHTLSATARWGSAGVPGTSTAEALNVIQQTRFDLKIGQTNVDAFRTTIDGGAFLSITSLALLPGYPADYAHTAIYPGYHGTKGYLNEIDLASTGMRFTLEESSSYSQAYCSVNGGSTTPATRDASGDWYCETSRLDDRPRIFLPANEVGNDPVDFRLRLEPIANIVDRLGNEVFNGAPDPGVGLACDVSTQGVLPGTVAGTPSPNNNCRVVRYIPPVMGTNYKHNSGGYQNIEVLGETYSLVAPAVPEGGNIFGYPIKSVIGVEPRSFAETNDLAVCDVWIPGTERFAPASNASSPFVHVSLSNPANVGILTLPRVESSFPGAVVYYTTLNLAGGGTANCGTPGDGVSGWTTVRPAETQISGWMVVFPGQNTLAAPFWLVTSKSGSDPANYTTVITLNVTNHMGIVPDSSTGQTAVSTSSYFHVISDIALVRVPDHRLSGGDIGIGAHTLQAEAGGNINLSSSQPLNDPNGVVTIRVQIDNCLENVVATSPNTIVVVGPDQGAGACGVTEGSSYVERVMTFAEWFELQWAGDPIRNWARIVWPVSYSFDTPAWALPGDTFVNRETISIPAEGGESFWTRADNDRAVQDLRITIPSSAVVSSMKSVEQTTILPDQGFTHLIGWYNYTDVELGATTFVDVLPFNGDGRGTSFSGTLSLESVLYDGRAGAENNTLVEYTMADPTLVAANPNDSSIVWCAESALGAAGCPSSVSETTALRFTTENFSINHSQFFRLTFSTSGNMADDRYTNALSPGSAAGLGQPIPAPAPVTTLVEASPTPEPTATETPTQTPPSTPVTPATPTAEATPTSPVTPVPTEPVPATPTPTDPATPGATPVNPTPTATTPVTGLPDTGTGGSVAMPGMIAVLTVLTMTIGAFGVLRERAGSS